MVQRSVLCVLSVVSLLAGNSYRTEYAVSYLLASIMTFAVVCAAVLLAVLS